MKRNPNIVPLSKEHHFGLLHVWKIRQGLKKEIAPARIAQYVVFHWEHEQKAHFEEEEKYLFPYITNKLIDQALEEHHLLRDLIAQITTQPTATLLEEYATRLNDHIRYEERVLFPYMEENLSEEQLTEIGKNLSADPHTEEESYSDEFWQ